MVYRRRRRGQKRYNRRRRTYRRSFRKRGYGRNNKVYYFKRNFTWPILAVGGVNFTAEGFTFTLADLPNVAEFQNLFDSYQIRAIKLTFRPEQTQSISLNDIANAQIYYRFFSAIDYNDASAPQNADILRQYSTVKVTALNKVHTRYFKPKTVDDNGSNPGVRPWLPTKSNQIPHYGLRVFVESTGATGGFVFNYSIEGTMYCAFKNVL